MGLGLPYHVHVENTPRHRRLSATKTRPTGVVERALAWAGRGARRMHRAGILAPESAAAMWGSSQIVTAKKPCTGNGQGPPGAGSLSAPPAHCPRPPIAARTA